MSSTTVPVHTHRLPSPALRRFAWGVLIYFIAVILWGGLVRATGSGAGCGDHWPLCNGTVMQHSARIDTMIEFTHRITSGLSFFLVVALLAWTLAGTARGHLARGAAVAAVAFTVIEAALGAFLVKLGLTAQSHSPLRAPYLALHLTNTLLLLAALTLTAHLLGRRAGYLRGRRSSGCAVRRDCAGSRAADCRRDRIAGCAGRYAFSGELAGGGFCPGFFGDERLAGALALDAPDGCVPGQRLSRLAAGARGPAPDALGQPRLSALVLILLVLQYCAGRSRRGISRAGVAADCAPVGRRRAVGCAGGAGGADRAGTGGRKLASRRVSRSASQKLASGLTLSVLSQDRFDVFANCGLCRHCKTGFARRT